MEISLQIPNDIAELLKDTGKSIYIEAVKTVAASRLNSVARRISELDNEIAVYEKKYNSNFADFQLVIPDTFEAHTDWQEWDYLVSVKKQYQKKYKNLSLILEK